MALSRRSGRLAVAAACAAALAACTPAPSTSASPASASPSSPAAGTSSSSGIPSGAVTIDITIRKGQVTPNGQKINLTRGQTVVLRVTSDADDEVHAHTAGAGYELEVHPGQPAQGQFVAADTGTFEVELHHLNKIVALLVVR